MRWGRVGGAGSAAALRKGPRVGLRSLAAKLRRTRRRGLQERFSFIVTLHLHIDLCPVTTRSRRKIKRFKMKKIDLCLSSEGAEVILATSSDEKHPPENMIDGNPDTFWTTTGMFPQEFIICFHKHVRIERLVIQSYFVRTLRIEKSTSKEPVDFEPWIERDLVHTEGQLQNEEIMVSVPEGLDLLEDQARMPPPMTGFPDPPSSKGLLSPLYSQISAPGPNEALPAYGIFADQITLGYN
ncbi:intraflagellar transport protein 25 homolog isoform X4 [Acinonyx jubatus]|uniref:Intraflagellar transport protein 25 homolog isoform X4 n=1 Tax=Acinonyx jubatus TaxID=32536 RepID=A0ABM3PEE0_ACIJB|nr:intraflagellar transport protein 25 homolog isoform X4 [Acinonyx jubatus]